MVVTFLLLTAFEFTVPAGKSGGMGAGMAIIDWKHSLLFNPGLISYAPKFGGAVAYTMPYGIKELYSGMLGICFRAGRINVGVGSFMTGIGNYQELDVNLVLGGRIIKELSAGIAVHGYMQSAGRYGGDFVPGLDLGFFWNGDRWGVGIAGHRLNAPRLRSGDELTTGFKAGIFWEPVSSLTLAIDVERTGEEERAVAGVEFKLFSQISVRGGYQTSPQCFNGGVGVNWNRFTLDYGYQYHPQLGDTHIFGVGIRWD